MKADRCSVLILFSAWSCLLYGCASKPNRIVTFEQWTKGDCVVWAVQDSRILIYQLDDYVKKTVANQAVIPVDSQAIVSIRESLQHIPADAFGRLYWDGGPLHGPLFRLQFSEDGEDSERTIEVCGVFVSWMDQISKSIAAALSRGRKPEYAELIAQWEGSIPKELSVDERQIVTRDLVEYYSGKK